MSGVRSSATLVLQPVDELAEHASRVRLGPGARAGGGAFCSAGKAWGPYEVEIAAVQGLDLARHGRRSLHKWLQRRPEDVRRLVAGAFSGAVSKTATAPLEKIRLSLMTSSSSNSMLDTVLSTWRSGGPLAFFSGNAADVLRVMPSKAIEFTAFDAYKKVLCQRDPVSGRYSYGPGSSALAGGAAGLTSTVLCFPLETIRTRLAVAPRGQYRGMLHCTRQIIAEEGCGALFKGLQASMLGVVPYAALRFTAYDGLKRAYKHHTKRDELSPGASMACGALAGLLASTATFPLEVVRRRMMNGAQLSPNVFVAVQTIARNEGWKALYRGLLVSCIKQVPQNAVAFTAFESAKQWLDVESVV